MRHTAVLTANAVALAGVGLGVTLWVRQFHSPDDGAPIGAGLVYLALVVGVPAVTTYFLHAGADRPGAAMALTVLNVAIGAAVQYVLFALKDGLSQAGELAGIATVCILVGAGVGAAVGSAARP